MKFTMKKSAVVATALAGTFLLSACGPSESDASVASRNMSVAADQFEIDRRVVVYNGITDKLVMTIEGKCSITDQGNQLEIMCRIGENEYAKHFAGLSDNVTYFVEQLETSDVSVYHHRIIYKPETLDPISGIEIETGKQ